MAEPSPRTIPLDYWEGWPFQSYFACRLFSYNLRLTISKFYYLSFFFSYFLSFFLSFLFFLLSFRIQFLCKITSNDFQVTLGDLQMTMTPSTAVSMARTSKMLQKLSNIWDLSSYSTSFAKKKNLIFTFWERWPTKQVYIYEQGFYRYCKQPIL